MGSSAKRYIYFLEGKKYETMGVGVQGFEWMVGCSIAWAVASFLFSTHGDL